MDSLVVKLLDRVMEMADHPNDVTGVPTGFYDLDRMTAGFQAGDLIVLAARPSMGKTALAINIAEHVALHEGLPVAVFSMEMSASQLAVRVVGSIGRIDQNHLRNGRLTDEEWPRLTEAIEKLRNISLHIDESSGLTPCELRGNARRLARQCGQLGLIVVDYLQLMSGSTNDGENRATELGEIDITRQVRQRNLIAACRNRLDNPYRQTPVQPFLDDPFRLAGARRRTVWWTGHLSG